MTRRPLPTKRYLLPHEKWRARKLLARADSNPSSVLQRWKKDYGPEGVTLLAAALANLLPAIWIGWPGGVLMVISMTKGTLAFISLIMICAGFCLALLGTFRALQGRAAGDRWYGDWPASGSPTTA